MLASASGAIQITSFQCVLRPDILSGGPESMGSCRRSVRSALTGPRRLRASNIRAAMSFAERAQCRLFGPRALMGMMT